MVRSVSFGLLLLWSATALAIEQPALSHERLVEIKGTLRRSLCYSVYWLGRDYRVGLALPLRVKAEGEQFFAWVDDLEVTKRDRMAAFVTGRLRGGGAIVVLERGYNLNLVPQVPGYAEDRHHFETGTIVEDKVTIPRDCAPGYDPATPQKERMLQTVVSTLQKQLSSFVRTGASRYPGQVTLTIANFNVDYPRTYVLVEPPGHLFTVTLHDPRDYDSDVYERQGEYPLGEIRVKPYHKDLLAKIRKHGIVRKITLTP